MTIQIPLQERVESSDKRLSPLFPLEAEVASAVHNAGFDSIGASNTAWTAAIKAALSGLAIQRGLLPCPNNLEDDFGRGHWQFSGEWLLDHIWLAVKRNADGSFDWRECRGLVLACESEWLTGEYHVLEDFLKLTIVLADLRLLIYTNEPVEDGRHPVDVCRRACTLSRGYRYMTMGFPSSISVATMGQHSTRIDAWTA